MRVLPHSSAAAVCHCKPPHAIPTSGKPAVDDGPLAAGTVDLRYSDEGFHRFAAEYTV